MKTAAYHKLFLSSCIWVLGVWQDGTLCLLKRAQKHIDIFEQYQDHTYKFAVTFHSPLQSWNSFFTLQPSEKSG